MIAKPLLVTILIVEFALLLTLNYDKPVRNNFLELPRDCKQVFTPTGKATRRKAYENENLIELLASLWISPVKLEKI